MTGERPEQSGHPIEEAAEQPEPPGEEGEAYSSDEEAAVAARLEDLGYI